MLVSSMQYMVPTWHFTVLSCGLHLSLSRSPCPIIGVCIYFYNQKGMCPLVIWPGNGPLPGQIIARSDYQRAHALLIVEINAYTDMCIYIYRHYIYIYIIYIYIVYIYIHIIYIYIYIYVLLCIYIYIMYIYICNVYIYIYTQRWTRER